MYALAVREVLAEPPVSAKPSMRIYPIMHLTAPTTASAYSSCCGDLRQLFSRVGTGSQHSARQVPMGGYSLDIDHVNNAVRIDVIF